MAEKRKISVRKILQMLLTAVVATCCVLAIVSASRIEGQQTLRQLPVVHISNDRKYNIDEQKNIMDLAIYNRNIDIMHIPVSKMDLNGIEKAILADPWVADAQAYIDIDRLMHIYVTQRLPVVRIYNQAGDSYYMDSTLHTMPLSPSYTYYTPIVTNAPAMASDSFGTSLKAQVLAVVKAITADSFWSAQVSHVVMDKSAQFEIIPVLGSHKIVLGDTACLEDKFNNLLLFYRNVLNRIGWDKYTLLDARFRSQVVASPAIQDNGPKDKAFERMSWVASVKAAQEGSRTVDSLNTVYKIAAKTAAANITAAAKAQQELNKKNKQQKGKEQAPKGKEQPQKAKAPEAKHKESKKKHTAKAKASTKNTKATSHRKNISSAPTKSSKSVAPAKPAAKKVVEKKAPAKSEVSKPSSKPKENVKQTGKGKYTYPE